MNSPLTPPDYPRDAADDGQRAPPLDGFTMPTRFTCKEVT
jgi:hypothetical protein